MPGSSLASRLGALLVTAVVGGLLMSAVLLPFVGGAGLAARSAADGFQSLPSDLKVDPLAQVSKIVSADGKPIATFYDQDRVSVPLSDVPQQMQMALIAVEDVRFYENNGVDLKGTLRALLRNGSSGSVSQGGSTLTQQYVKNVLIEDAKTPAQAAAARADTLSRKIREARYALALDDHLTKAQILERYLNIAYFGDGAYGVGTAAEHYFGEPVQQLTLAQSALLAGIVQSPVSYDPRLHPQLSRQRRDVVLGQMLKYHFIGQSAYAAAYATPVTLHVHAQSNGCSTSPYPYFCDYVLTTLKATLPASVLRAGGLTVTTTLDPKTQKAAEAGLHDYVHAHESNHVTGAEAIVAPGTGQVKALAVSAAYGYDAKKGENSIDYAVDQEKDGIKYNGSPGFHAGSTFKLFVMAAALKEGLPLSTTFDSPPTITVKDYKNCAGDDVGDYPLHNDSLGEGGTYNLKSATWFSVNTYFAQLEQRTGLCEPVKLAEAMGVTQGTGANPAQVPSFVLGAGGSYGFTPLDVAGAYATMAAQGRYCSPVVMTSVVDRTGHHYPVPQAHCQQVVPPGLANTITSILQGVLTVRGATGAGLGLTGRPAAAKTGTVDDYTQSWFAGYTPQLASAVWVGDPSDPNKPLQGQTIGGHYYGGPVFGATIAGPIWKTSMEAALTGRPVVAFTGPDYTYEQGTTTPVPSLYGMSAHSAEQALTSAGFSPRLEPYRVASSEPAGTVAYTSPGAGTSSYAGMPVEIFLSTGVAPAPSPSSSPTSSAGAGGKGGGGGHGGGTSPGAPSPPAPGPSHAKPGKH